MLFLVFAGFIGVSILLAVACALAETHGRILERRQRDNGSTWAFTGAAVIITLIAFAFTYLLGKVLLE